MEAGKSCEICGAPARFLVNGTIYVCVDCLYSMQDPDLFPDIEEALEIDDEDDDE